jgi:hypothetical protein
VSVETLVDDVIERSELPLDRWEVAALLESEGVRDLDARERYGHADVFGLADEVYAKARARVRADPPSRRPPARDPWLRRMGSGLVHYAHGSFFLIPMTVQVIALFAFGFGLFISLDFTHSQFTAIAIATIASFVVTDGFVAALGRLAGVYGDQGKHALAQASAGRVLALGIGAAGLVAAAWLVVAAVTHVLFPHRLVSVAVGYFLLLSLLWLSTALLYVVRQRRAIVLATVVGLAAVGLLGAAGLGLYASQWLAIGSAAAFALIWGGTLLALRTRRATGPARLARMPRAALLVYSVLPYFLYGGLYYGFLFSDRLVAWAGPGRPEGWTLWFRTPYELGLDWALTSLLPSIALLEYTINRFGEDLVPRQKRTSGLAIADLNRDVLRFYRRQVALFAVVTTASAAAFYLLGLWLRRFDDVPKIHDFFASETTFDVHHVGLIGYSLFAFGLLNGVFLGTLSRPWLVLRALAAGTLVSLVTGALLTRTLDEYWYAAVGMAAGSAVFALMTTWSAVRLLRRADYHVYAAY